MTALTVPAFRNACIARKITKGTIAVAFTDIGKPVPPIRDLTVAAAALTDEERGRLADALGLVR